MDRIFIQQIVLDKELLVAVRTFLLEDLTIYTAVTQIRILLDVHSIIDCHIKHISTIRTFIFHIMILAH